MATDIGKVFEDELEKVFKRLKTDYLLGWHRFPDTHSAGGGNVIQPQPSDYLLGLPPGAHIPYDSGSVNVNRMAFFEAKATEKHASLQKSAIRPEQRGFIHFYVGMLHLPYLVCHYSTVTGNIQLWDGRAVMDDRLDKQHILLEFPAGDGRKLRQESVAQAFVNFFSLPQKFKTAKLYGKF